MQGERAPPRSSRAIASRSSPDSVDLMMRLFHASTVIVIAASAALTNACDRNAGRESAASHPPDSALARDLAVAASGAPASGVGARDTLIAPEPAGTPDSSAGETGATDGLPSTSNATDALPTAAPSAEGYIGPSCASPTRSDQQRCLTEYLTKSDALLDRYYQALILRLESEAGATSRSTEPASVRRLRTAQRAWLVYRDDECRKRTRAREGPLWAPVRAQCLAGYSAVRAQELRDALARRKALAPRVGPSKSTGPSARVTARRTP
jgi:uncharacterized protein YecT (DUF1311 family)